MRARPTIATLLAVAALGTAAAGCGGDDDSSTSEPAPASTSQPTATTAPTSGGDTATGMDVFTNNCAGCHTLSDAGATGTVGPDLDQLQPDQAAVEEQVTNGGGAMPAFAGQLSETEIQEVAAYVATAAGG